jgi:hypothetical protein
MSDGDQALAAEPSFHGNPPQGGGSVVITERRLSGNYSELVEQQPENGLALAQRGGAAANGARTAESARWSPARCNTRTRLSAHLENLRRTGRC